MGIVGCVVLLILLVGGFSISGSLIRREPVSIIIECADGRENEDFSCNEAADFDSDFEGNPSIQSQVYDTVPWCCGTSISEQSPLNTLVKSFQIPSDGRIPFRGISLAGGEFSNSFNNTDAANGNYLPFDNDAALFISKGMNTFRIPITWEYFADRRGIIFPTGNYIERLDRVINGLLARNNTYVILELHNYMRYNLNDVSRNVANTQPDGEDVIRPCMAPPSVWCSGVATSSFAVLWRNIVTRYHSPRMIYGIMNEPHDIAYTRLNAVTLLAFQAIRRAENDTADRVRHLILLSGNQYTGLHSWFEPNFQGLSNAQNTEFYDMLRERFGSDFAIEVHQYFDDDSSGTYVTNNHDCLPFANFTARFDEYWPRFMNWSITNRHQVFLGEFGVPDTPTCRVDVQHLLDAFTRFAYSPSRGYGVIGWTLWAGGNSWGDYILSLAPGSKTNALLQGNVTYEKYLDPVAPIPPINNETRAISIENRSNETLKFAGGYLPFEFLGSAEIPSGGVNYLYSNNMNNTPTGDGGLQIRYYIGDDKSRVIGFGIDPPKDGTRYAYGFSNIPQLVISSYNAPRCTIIAGGPQSNPPEARCFVVTNA